MSVAHAAIKRINTTVVVLVGGQGQDAMLVSLHIHSVIYTTLKMVMFPSEPKALTGIIIADNCLMETIVFV